MTCVLAAFPPPCAKVPAFDRKLAMMAPGAWMAVLGMVAVPSHAAHVRGFNSSVLSRSPPIRKARIYPS